MSILDLLSYDIKQLFIILLYFIMLNFISKYEL